MSEFIDMGGYAFYVWSSFGLSLIGILYIYFSARNYSAKQHDEIRSWIKRTEN